MSKLVFNPFTGFDSRTDKLDELDMVKVGNPIHVDNFQEIYNHMYSAGITHNCELTDNGDGTINIAAGTAVLRAAADIHSTLYSVEVNAQAGITLTDNSVNYVYLDYNSGSPQFVVSTSITAFNGMDKCLAYTIVREGTTLHYINATEQNVDSNRKHRRMLLETGGFEHVVGGTALSEVGTRNISVTAGGFYYGLNRIDHSAFNTSTGSTFTYYYRDGVSGWTKVTAQTQIDNLQYDNGTGTLATLSNNKYGVHWVYILNNSPSSLVVQYGQGDYNTLSDARVATVPTAPPAMNGVGALIGRIIIQKSASSFSSTDSAFLQTFTPSAATNHNNLAGLQGGTIGEYYHVTAAQHAALTNLIPVESSQSLNNGATMTLTAGGNQTVIVSGNAVAATLAGITHSALSNGDMVYLVGGSDTNTVTVVSASGLVLNGSCTLALNDVLTLRRVSGTLVEVSRSN